MSFKTINTSSKMLQSRFGEQFSLDELQSDVNRALLVGSDKFMFTAGTMQSAVNACTRLLELVPKIVWTPHTVVVDGETYENRKIGALCNFVAPQIVTANKIYWSLAFYEKIPDYDPDTMSALVVAVHFGPSRLLCISGQPRLKYLMDNSVAEVAIHVFSPEQLKMCRY